MGRRFVTHWSQRVNQGKKRGLAVGYRSGLEGANAKHLESHGEPVLYETFRIKYVVPQKEHHYTPDFRLRNGIIVETKGVWDATDRAKHLLVRAQYPELDLRLVFSRGKSPINPGSSTTCGQWADKHGIKWAEKLIPEAWLREPGPKTPPEEVLKRPPLGYEDIIKLPLPKRR